MLLLNFFSPNINTLHCKWVVLDLKVSLLFFIFKIKSISSISAYLLVLNWAYSRISFWSECCSLTIHSESTFGPGRNLYHGPLWAVDEDGPSGSEINNRPHPEFYFNIQYLWMNSKPDKILLLIKWINTGKTHFNNGCLLSEGKITYVHAIDRTSYYCQCNGTGDNKMCSPRCVPNSASKKCQLGQISEVLWNLRSHNPFLSLWNLIQILTNIFCALIHTSIC